MQINILNRNKVKQQDIFKKKRTMIFRNLIELFFFLFFLGYQTLWTIVSPPFIYEKVTQLIRKYGITTILVYANGYFEADQIDWFGWIWFSSFGIVVITSSKKRHMCIVTKGLLSKTSPILNCIFINQS